MISKFLYAPIFLAITAALFFGFFHHFDITDEGYHLYHNVFGLEARNSIMIYQVVPYLLGHLFDHQILGFRFATFIVNSLLALYVSLSAQKYFGDKSPLFVLFGLLSSFNLYVFITSFDYNASTTFGIYLWLGSVLRLYAPDAPSKKAIWMHTALMGIGASWAVLGKFTAGIPLMLITPFVLFVVNLLLEKKKSFLIVEYIVAQMVSFVVVLYGMHLLAPTFWENYLYHFKTFMNMPGVGNSLPSLFLLYFLSTGQFFFYLLIRGWGIAFGLCLYFFCKAQRQNKTTHLAAMCYGILLVSTLYGLLNFDVFDSADPVYVPAFDLTKFWPAIVLIVWAAQWKTLIQNKRLLTFVLLCVGITAITPVGTNTDFMSKVSLSGVPYGLLFAVLLMHLQRHYKDVFALPRMRFFIPTAFVCLGLFVGVAVVHERVLFALRGAPLWQQTEVLEGESQIKHLRITQDQKNTLESIRDRLLQNGFDPKQDRMFAYADTPGYLSALGFKSFGENWVITNYAVSNARACHYLKSDKHAVRHVYVLQSALMPQEVQPCLIETIRPTAQTRELLKMDAGYHYRARRDHAVVLTGPYEPKEERR